MVISGGSNRYAIAGEGENDQKGKGKTQTT
jgi:hypothetical protein